MKTAQHMQHITGFEGRLMLSASLRHHAKPKILIAAIACAALTCSRNGLCETSASLDRAVPAVSTSMTQPLKEPGVPFSLDVGQRGGHTVRGVLELALKCNPNWETFSVNHAAAHAEFIKAQAFPNPEFEIEAGRATARERDESGERPTRGVYSLSFSQPIELPGKRAARAAEARAGFAVVDAEASEFRATLRADVLEAYYTVQYHATLEKLWSAQLTTAQELLHLADTRVSLGEAGRLEVTNARIETLKAQRQRDSESRRKTAARAALDALTGGKLGKGFKLADSLPTELGTRSVARARRSAFERHPRLYRLKTELEQKYASIDRARTEWWPDIKVGASSSSEFDARSNAITAGFEIPLWNRNQGGIAAAEAAARKTYNDLTIAMVELNRDVEQAFQLYQLAREQLLAFEDGLNEVSREALDIAWEQYRGGAAGYLDVLAARRLVQETQLGLVDARFEAARARAQMDRAAGIVLESPTTKDKRGENGGNGTP